jgi:hypothetical protein
VKDPGIDTNVGVGVGAGSKKPGWVDESIVKPVVEDEETSQDTRVLTAQALKIHEFFNKISDELETFLENGGQFNLRVYHNGGCESIDLHQLNGEFECSFLQTKVLKLHVPGELDDDGCKIA